MSRLLWPISLNVFKKEIAMGHMHLHSVSQRKKNICIVVFS